MSTQNLLFNAKILFYDFFTHAKSELLDRDGKNGWHQFFGSITATVPKKMRITALSDYFKDMPFYNHVYNNFYWPHTWLRAKCELCKHSVCMHAQTVTNDTSQVGVYVPFTLGN